MAISRQVSRHLFQHLFQHWTLIRRGERRDTTLAFLTLMFVMMAHSLVETARDTLFLTGLSATALPLVYLAVAVAALAVAFLQTGRNRAPSIGKLVPGMLVCAAITAGWGALARPNAPWTLYGLYIWSAMAVSMVVASLFVLLGERFTVAQAKRVYALVGTGSVVGAIVGSALASVLVSSVAPGVLLYAAGGVMAIGALGPLCLTPLSKAPRQSRDKQRQQLQQIARVFIHPYTGRVAALIVTSCMTFTLVDYVFKSTVAAAVVPEQLGAFFARAYLVLNVLSLGVQVVLVQPLLRRLSVATAFAVLPALLVVGGLTGLAIGPLLGAIALKGIDGSLRYSLHRTLGELLYLPLRKRLRVAAKLAIDLVGQRLGQALASVFILAAVGAGASIFHLALTLIVMAAAWVLQALALRPRYFRMFRNSLQDAGERSPKDFPELDISSLESVMAALNSNNDAEVRAALSFLEEQGRTRAIPSLILYHPSPAVVVDALDILARTTRTDFLPITLRLLDHEYAAVRAGALRARMARLPDEPLLRQKTDILCPVVRATALVGLVANGYETIEQSRIPLWEIIDNGSEIAREALAKAIAYQPADSFVNTLQQLARDDSPLVVLAAVEAIQQRPSVQLLPTLLPLLARRKLRPAVRNCLLKLKGEAFGFLVRALNDPNCEPSIRRHIPRSLSRFEPRLAVPTLLTVLVEHSDSWVRYKSLRGLGRLATEHPEIALDRRILRTYAESTIEGIFRFIHWQVLLSKGIRKQPERQTEAHELIVKFLADKEKNAMERLFRVLGLLYPNRSVATLYRGLNGQSRELRANSRELLEEFLRPPSFRTAVLGLADEAPFSVRLAAGGKYHEAQNMSYEQLLVQLLARPDETLRGLAAYQIGELNLTRLRPAVDAVPAAEGSFLAQALRRAEANLSQAIVGARQ